MNIEAKITPRLKMVASLVEKCDCVCDIGTDHAYLPIYLVKKGVCDRAVAADVNEGPLSAAKMNVVESKMSGKIKLVLSDGMENINKDDAEIFVIAGMGGDLICSILQGRKSGMDKFVLQPQRSFEVLRKYLWENGFEIKREAVAKEEGRMYCAMYAEYTGEKYNPSESEALCGKRELTENEPLFKEYMEYRQRIEENALKSLKKGGGSGERARELERKIEIYKSEGERK